MGNKPKARSKTKHKPSGRTAPTSRPTPAATAPEKQSRRWVRPTLYGLGAIGLIALLFAAFGGLAPESRDPPEGIERFTGLTGVHTTDPVLYEQDPPVGGDHNPIWLNCGYYPSPVPNENAVHALEHGVVWITYQPDLDESSVEKLKDLADQPEVLVSPYPGLESPVVASSWGNQLRLGGVEDERLKQFVRAMKNGPDAPEPLAGCQGGVGTPE